MAEIAAIRELIDMQSRGSSNRAKNLAVLGCYFASFAKLPTTSAAQFLSMQTLRRKRK